jgi:hypothetical protein
MPEQCANLTGSELGACLKEHRGTSDNAMSGTTGGMRGNARLPNNKSGSGSGDVSGGGTGTTGTTGSTGSSGTASGSAGTGAGK